MYHRIVAQAKPVLALAGLFLTAGPSFAQYSSFPGDWPQPGRGPGFGQGGFVPLPDGLSGYYTFPVSAAMTAPAMSVYQPSYASIESDRAYIRVRVPAGARVFFDDAPTRQAGTDRLFVSPPLDNGESYSYQVSARWMQDGRERQENRTVRVLPGQTVNVDFAAR
jgi:uncharacterized protein (TIGR03000 family)